MHYKSSRSYNVLNSFTLNRNALIGSASLKLIIFDLSRSILTIRSYSIPPLFLFRDGDLITKGLQKKKKKHEEDGYCTSPQNNRVSWLMSLEFCPQISQEPAEMI